MANYNNLKATIQAVIKANDNQEITGDIMQSVLLSIVNLLGSGYQFMGLAEPTTKPSASDARVFYFANQKGVYIYYDNLKVEIDEEICIFFFDTQWHKITIANKDADVVRYTSQNVTNSQKEQARTNIGALSSANGAVTAEKLDPDWRKNLAHKAVVYNYNTNTPADVPQLVQAYKADANKSVFLVYRSGMYYPAVLITQQDNEAIIFYQPEGINFQKIVIRKSGITEAKVYGSPAIYKTNAITYNEQRTARGNLGITITGNLTDDNIFPKGEMKGAIVFEASELATKGVYFESTKISLYLPCAIFISQTRNLKSVSCLSSVALNAIAEKITTEFPDSTGEIKAVYCKGWIRNFIVDDNIDDIVVVVKGNKTYSFGF
jgi:hypothetical protein